MSKTKLQVFLEQFYFVRWDRYVRTSNDCLYFYGWMDRKKDAYKDFIVVEWDIESRSASWFVTSSVAWDKEIKRIMGVKRGQGTKCQRVEHLTKIKNSIKL